MSISYEIQSRPRTALRRPSAPRQIWWQRTSVQLTGLVLWSLLLFFYGLQQGDLYRTEGLRAIIGKEMFHSGDWLVPRLYGEPILTKPPLFYWAIAATGTVFGEVTTWSARLPAAIAGLICVLIVYFTMRRYYGATNPYAFLAAFALPCSMMWLEKASSSEIDTMLVMWVLGAWACFLRVMEHVPSCGPSPIHTPTSCGRSPDRATHHSALSTQHSALLAWWLAALLCVAGGVLTKWTGFLFFYVMAIPLLAWHRQLWRLFHWHHLLAALLGAALVWCWLGAVVYELGWSNVIGMLWKEGAPRVLHGKNASQQLMLETAIHPFKVLAIALPWSIIAIIGLRRSIKAPTGLLKEPTGLRKEPTGLPRRLIERSLWCWALGGTLMMTLFPDHNIRQSFSLVPAWTLLGFTTLMSWMNAASGRWNVQRWIVAGLLLWTVVKVLHVEMIIPARFAKRPSPAEQAMILQEHVPVGTVLYLSKVKDECLMFNYGRTIRRLADWNQLPLPGDRWCVLTEAERASTTLPIIFEHTLLDAQGEPLILCRIRQRE